MTTTITDGTTAVEPVLVTSLETGSEGGTIVHPLLGGGAPDVTLRRSSLRSGTLELLFDDEVQAQTAYALHELLVTLTLTDDVDAWRSMRYVRTGRLALREEAGHDVWIVALAFQEVGP